MAQAPPNLVAMFNEFKRRAPKSWNVRLGGIVGDAAHGYGYHLAPQNLGSGDYSMQKAEDKGSGVNRSYASALDITMSPEGMKAVTANLIRAAESPTDNRVGWAREFYGTTNGNTVNGRIHDASGEGWSFASSDSSHLWHVHIGLFRRYNNDKAKLAQLLEVLLGTKDEGDDDVSAKEVWAEQSIPNPAWRADAKTNKEIKASSALFYALDEAHSAHVKADSLEKKVDALTVLVKQLLARG